LNPSRRFAYAGLVQPDEVFVVFRNLAGQRADLEGVCPPILADGRTSAAVPVSPALFKVPPFQLFGMMWRSMHVKALVFEPRSTV